MKKVYTFQNRLKKLGIEVEFKFRFPWVYLEKVNGVKVEETYHSKTKFVLGFNPYNDEDQFEFINGSDVFNVIRKYLDQ